MKEIVITDYLGNRLKTMQERAAKARRKGWLCLLSGSVFLIISNTAQQGLLSLLFLPSIILVLVGMWYLLRIAGHLRDIDKMERGLDGERRLKSILRNCLPDDYTAYFGVPVNGRGDIDCLVVGPDSVFALEVKNHDGIIELHDEDLEQIKIGRKGGIYNGGLRRQRPVSKFAGCIYGFKEALEAKKIRVWIEGAIVFTHPDVELNVAEARSFKIITADSVDDFINGSLLKKIGDRDRKKLVLYLDEVKAKFKEQRWAVKRTFP